jgi:hypothetical protein
MPLLRESIAMINRSSSLSTLIPLLTETDDIHFDPAYYEPGFVHFCDDIPLRMMKTVPSGLRTESSGFMNGCAGFSPSLGSIRSIPVPEPHLPDSERPGPPSIRIASLLDDSCDFFMTDTHGGMVGQGRHPHSSRGWIRRNHREML